MYDYVHMWMCTCVHVHVRACIWMCVCMYLNDLCVWGYTHVWMHVHVNTQVCTCMSVCVRNVRVSVCMHRGLKNVLSARHGVHPGIINLARSWSNSSFLSPRLPSWSYFHDAQVTVSIFFLFVNHSWLIHALQPFTNWYLCLEYSSLHLCQLTPSCHSPIGCSIISSEKSFQINHVSYIEKSPLFFLLLAPTPTWLHPSTSPEIWLAYSGYKINICWVNELMSFIFL